MMSSPPDTICMTHPPMSVLKQFKNRELSTTDYQAVMFHLDCCLPCREQIYGTSAVIAPSTNRYRAFNKTKDPETEPLVTHGLSQRMDPLQLLPSELRNHSRYEVTDLIGVGGMGSVYKAWDRKNHINVAIKVINSQSDKEHLARFRREVDLQKKLSDPHIVYAYETETIGKTSFLVMELLQGAGTERLIVRNGNLSLADACEIICQAAIGLHHAHERSLIHRDIKPSNLYVTNSGVVKVLDFGLSRLTEAAAESTGGMHSMRLTGERQAVGTMEYMAPEQAIDSRSVDPRADIYSLGATFYAMLAGKPPPMGNMETGTDAWTRLWMGKVNSNIPSISKKRSDVPFKIDQIISKMLAVIPEERYASVLDVLEELQPYSKYSNLFALLGLPRPVEQQPIVIYRPVSQIRRNLGIATAAAVIGFLLAYVLYAL